MASKFIKWPAGKKIISLTFDRTEEAINFSNNSGMLIVHGAQDCRLFSFEHVSCSI